jgi:hypothetical protein
MKEPNLTPPDLVLATVFNMAPLSCDDGDSVFFTGEEFFVSEISGEGAPIATFCPVNVLSIFGSNSNQIQQVMFTQMFLLNFRMLNNHNNYNVIKPQC